jgi:hypothetical protein
MKRLFIVLSLFVAVTTGFAIDADPAEAAPAAILTVSQTTQACERVDPIVSPGTASAHPHKFYGAGSAAQPVTSNTTTSAQFRALPSTWTRASNHSGFWIPCLYEDGVLVPPSTKAGLFYYQPVSGTEQVPPENTKGVTHEVGYRCGFGGGTVTNLPPATCPSGEFVISGFFRASRDLGLSVPYPTIRFFLRFNTGPTLGRLTLGTPAGGEPGAMTMDDIHADYFFAHDRAKFQAFLNQCVIPGASCGTDPAVLA